MCALWHFRLGDRALIRGRAGAERRAANTWSPVLADSEARRRFLFGTRSLICSEKVAALPFGFAFPRAREGGASVSGFDPAVPARSYGDCSARADRNR